MEILLSKMSHVYTTDIMAIVSTVDQIYDSRNCVKPPSMLSPRVWQWISNAGKIHTLNDGM